MGVLRNGIAKKWKCFKWECFEMGVLSNGCTKK